MWKLRCTPTAVSIVAGHRGLVGSALVRRLEAGGFTNILTATREQLDLRDQSEVSHWFKANRPEFVFLVAGTRRRDPGQLHASGRVHLRQHDDPRHRGRGRPPVRQSQAALPRLVVHLPACRRRSRSQETELLTGPLEPTNEWYAIAKIAGIKLCQAYRQQYGARLHLGDADEPVRAERQLRPHLEPRAPGADPQVPRRQAEPTTRGRDLGDRVADARVPPRRRPRRRLPVPDGALRRRLATSTSGPASTCRSATSPRLVRDDRATPRPSCGSTHRSPTARHARCSTSPGSATSDGRRRSISTTGIRTTYEWFLDQSRRRRGRPRHRRRDRRGSADAGRTASPASPVRTVRTSPSCCSSRATRCTASCGGRASVARVSDRVAPARRRRATDVALRRPRRSARPGADHRRRSARTRCTTSPRRATSRCQLRRAGVHRVGHRPRHDAAARGDPDVGCRGPLLPGVVVGDVRLVAAAAERGDAVPSAQPVRRRQGVRATGRPSTTARRTGCSPRTGSCSTTRARAGARTSSPARSPGRRRHRAPARQEKLHLGNLDARRDWGFAGDYVEAMWRMLQQDEPDDFVIATGEAHTVARVLRARLRARRARLRGARRQSTSASSGPPRSTTSSATPRKAERELGWKPNTSFRDLVRMMVDADVAAT